MHILMSNSVVKDIEECIYWQAYKVFSIVQLLLPVRLRTSLDVCLSNASAKFIILDQLK